VRTGYEVIRVPLHQSGHASGEYEDFLTSFVLPNGRVWGRPVGVAVAADGLLLVTGDASKFDLADQLHGQITQAARQGGWCSRSSVVPFLSA
jgi:glucose/arabinose dehydrogenase